MKVTSPKYKPPSGSGIKDNSNIDEIFRKGENPSPLSPKPGFNKIHNDSYEERIAVLVQALRLTLRHMNGKSGLDKHEFKAYIETVLKVY